MSAQVQDDLPPVLWLQSRLDRFHDENHYRYTAQMWLAQSSGNEDAVMKNSVRAWAIDFLSAAVKDLLLYVCAGTPIDADDQGYQVFWYRHALMWGQSQSRIFSDTQLEKMMAFQQATYGPTSGDDEVSSLSMAQVFALAADFLKSVVENFDECFPRAFYSKRLAQTWNLEGQELSDKTREFYRAALTEVAADMLGFIDQLRQEGVAEELAAAAREILGKKPEKTHEKTMGEIFDIRPFDLVNQKVS